MQSKEESAIKVIQNWYKKYKNQTILTTSCGATASLLIDLADKSKCNIPVVFIDTGFLFEETVDYYERLRAKYDKLFFVRLKEHNDKTVFYHIIDEKISITDTSYCCNVNKVDILKKFLIDNNIKCWLTALRKDQNDLREKLSEYQKNSDGIYKVSPVIDWSSEEVFDYIEKYNLPLHPLYNLGYESIGCSPCTHKGSGRKGRWKNEEKIECGLHL